MAILNKDFREFIEALNRFDVEYLVVGGYAVIMRGHSRSTGDLDIWIKPSTDNFAKLQHALLQFGLPKEAIDEYAFLHGPHDVFAFGRPPVAIEVMTAVKGLDFDSTFSMASWYDDEGVSIKVIHINHLREAKKAAGRYKDLDDLENLR